MTLEPLTCPNCGGRVNEAKFVCEYCGTQFKSAEPDLGVIRFEHYTAPTRILKAECRIPNEMHDIAPEHVIPYAQRELAEKLVDNLLQGNMIDFRSQMDWKTCQQIISARLRVLDPHYRF